MTIDGGQTHRQMNIPMHAEETYWTNSIEPTTLQLPDYQQTDFPDAIVSVVQG